MADEAERKILDMVEAGTISPEEGLRLINAMGGSKKAATREAVEGEAIPAGEGPLQLSPEEQQRMNRLKRWWVLPFGVGLVITTLGAIWMYTAYGAGGFGWGFWLAWIPFILGIFLVAVSFQTSRSVWLHVRVRQNPGDFPSRVAISLPMPLGLTRWILRHFGGRIPSLQGQPYGDYADILENLSPDEPFYVHVHGDDGEEVEVFIG